MERMLNWLCMHPDNPLRKFMIGYYIVAIVSVIVATALQLAGLDFVYVFLALLVALTIPVAVPIIAFVTLPYVRDTQQIRRGDYWVRWQYTGDEWERFETHTWIENRRLMKLSPIFAGVLGVPVALITWYGSQDISTVFWMFGILLGVGVLASVQFWFEGRSHRVGAKGDRSDVYINQKGVLRPQGYLPISGFNINLVDVIVEPTTSGVTVMRFKVGSLTENLVARVNEFEVPVPDGREAEAITLAERLLRQS